MLAGCGAGRVRGARAAPSFAGHHLPHSPCALPDTRKVSSKLTIIVEDRNDNAPVFYNLPYAATIPEVRPRDLPTPVGSRAGALGGSCGTGVLAVGRQCAGNRVAPHLGVR